MSWIEEIRASQARIAAAKAALKNVRMREKLNIQESRISASVTWQRYVEMCQDAKRRYEAARDAALEAARDAKRRYEAAKDAALEAARDAKRAYEQTYDLDKKLALEEYNKSKGTLDANPRDIFAAINELQLAEREFDEIQNKFKEIQRRFQ